MTFDAHSHEYKCCCNSCHVKTGTLVIGVLEAIFLALQVASVAYDGTHGSGFSSVIAIVGVVMTSLQVIVLICLFLGLCRESACFLLPHLIVQAIGIIVALALAVAIIGLLVTGSAALANFLGMMETEANKATGGHSALTNTLYGVSTNSTSVDKVEDESLSTIFTKTVIGVGVCLGVMMLVYFGISIWLFLVVLHCYRYFRAKDHAEEKVLELDKLAGDTLKSSNNVHLVLRTTEETTTTDNQERSNCYSEIFR